MSRGMMKTTLREIKSSLGRYLAILLIIALGVGFFAGLKVTHKVMVHTADLYLSSLNFYDFRLISTIGFDETTAELLSGEADVKAAEGVKSADILVTMPDGREAAVKTISVPEQVNQTELLSGRMPEQKNECVVDAALARSASVGETLTLADTNESGDLEKFNFREFTIVGVVRSSLYIRYDRGTTSIGNGSLDGFIYLPKAAYDMDYDTEIAVAFAQMPSLYTEEYDAFIEEKKEQWKSLCRQAADSRYERIFEEAEEELADAQKELEEKKEEGRQELEEAAAELDDGRKQLADGESAIENAKNKLADSEKILAEQETEYREGLRAYQEGLEEYEQGEKALEAARQTYDSQLQEYEKGFAEYSSGRSAYESSVAEYESAWAQYQAAKSFLSETEQAEQEAGLAVWKQQLDGTRDVLEGTGAQLAQAKAQLEEAEKTLAEKQQELAEAKKQLEQSKEQLDAGNAQLEAAKTELSAAKKEISEKESELSAAREKLETGEQEYADAYAEYREKLDEAEQGLSDAREELAEQEHPDIYVLGRDTNSGYVSFQSDSQIIREVANVFPVFFFLVAALVCMTTMTRMIEEQRMQVGILKALGYSEFAIIGKYLAYSGSAALIGGFGGFVAGSFLFPEVIWITYQMMYNMGTMHYVFDGKLALISVLIAFLCSAGTTFVACHQELREMAAALMRPKAPKAGKRVLFERIPAIWNRLKFLDKVSVRNLFRYKKRFFMMIIGISGCSALLVTGLGLKDSIADIADVQFGRIFVYDLSAELKGETAETPDIQVSGIRDFLRLSVKGVDVSKDGQTKNVNLVVAEETDRFGAYVDLHTEQGKPIAYPKEEQAVVSAKLAEELGIRVGDVITLQDSELAGGSVTVSGIYQNYFRHFVLLAPETYEVLFGEVPEYNELYLNVEEQADVHEVAAELMKQSDVGSVTVCADIKQNVADMMQSLNYVVLLVIACAAMLEFIVVYNLNNINITERMREIATIKVLGFYRKETNSYIFRENIVLTVIAGLIGLLLGHFLHAFVMAQINLDEISFDVHVTGLSYALSLVLTVIFNQLVSLVMSGKLEKIDMAESLKSVD
ncbi:MAG: ABC transporter permease [Lachnospiraceae bacterium]|nr:ABC transporter permease [Lachnospiraceae bacterium]